MNNHGKNSLFEKAMLAWLTEFAAQGLLVTDENLRIRSCNKWFEKSCGKAGGDLIGNGLIEVFPELKARGFDRYYREALNGQSRILSHRLHKYLIHMPPPEVTHEIAQMQQSARISPLFDGDRVIGTITVVDDVTKRVIREMRLNYQIEERENQLANEKKARRLAEENSRLKDSNEALRSMSIKLRESEKARGKLLHQVIAAQEEERKRISRNIHDHLGQQLTALRLILSSLKQQSPPSSQLDKVYSIAEKLDSEVDFLVWELRPTVLDDLGLIKALENFINEWSRYLKISVELHATGLKGKRLSPEIEINLYRIVQEALNNVSKHAEANRVSVLLEKQDKNVVLIVEDDGIGFDPSVNEKPKGKEKGFGLLGIKERALLVGGTIEIESAKEHGTTLYVRIPIQTSHEAESSIHSFEL